MLKWVENNSFDVFIDDCSLSLKLGISARKEVAQVYRFHDFPTLLIIAEKDQAHAYDQLLPRFADYVCRPINPNELMIRLHSLLVRCEEELEITENAQCDVTTQEASQKFLEAERYSLAMEGSKDGIFDWDLKTSKVIYSRSWAHMIGYTPSEIAPLPASWINRVHPEDLRSLTAAIDTNVESQAKHFQHEYRMRHRNGEYYWMLLRCTIVRNHTRKAMRLVGVQTNIHELKDIQEKLSYNAFHDTLTGLPNRSLFTERLNQAFLRFKRQASKKFALLFIDLDRFKQINDTYGHDAGDKLLKEVTPRLLHAVRASDTVARMGGDEFTVVLEDTHSYEALAVFLDRLMENVCEPVMIAGIEIKPSLSIGACIVEHDHHSPDALLRDADVALYQAKQRGRGCYMFYDHQLKADQPKSAVIRSNLSLSLSKNEIVMHYQPIFSMKSQEVVGFEALMRWDHPKLGLVSPDDFISVAEENNVILELGDFAIAESLKFLSHLQRKYPQFKKMFMCINIAKKQIFQKDFLENLQLATARNQVEPGQVILEMSELTFRELQDQKSNVLSDCRALGYKVALDDFGQGESSLYALTRYQINYVKLDRDLTLDILMREEIPKFYTMITSLSRGTTFQLIAEGVQSYEIYKEILKFDVPFGQGFYFSVPLPASDMERLLKKLCRISG